MASKAVAKLHQLRSKASQASQVLTKHGSAYYKQLLEENKQYIQEPPTVEKCNLLSKQLFYTRLARLGSYFNWSRYASVLKCSNHFKILWLSWSYNIFSGIIASKFWFFFWMPVVILHEAFFFHCQYLVPTPKEKTKQKENVKEKRRNVSFCIRS